MDWSRVLVGRSVWRTLGRAAMLAVLLLVISKTMVTPLRAQGPSMRPAYHEGQLLLVNRLAYVWREPARGDVVAIRIANGRAALVKRVVALPGERVRITGGVVFVDDEPLHERYVRHRAAWDVPEVEVGPDELFVIGDNRGMPARAHDFGRASRSRLMGRLVY